MHASKVIVWIIVGLAGLVIVLMAFRAGVMVGYRQAEYSSEWQHFHGSAAINGANGGPRGFLNDHGSVGTITAVNVISSATTSITIHDADDNADKIVLIGAETTVLPRTSTSTALVLQVGQTIAAIGTPNTQGEIVASIIRLLPPPPAQQ